MRDDHSDKSKGSQHKARADSSYILDVEQAELGNRMDIGGDMGEEIWMTLCLGPSKGMDVVSFTEMRKSGVQSMLILGWMSTDTHY